MGAISRAAKSLGERAKSHARSLLVLAAIGCSDPSVALPEQNVAGDPGLASPAGGEAASGPSTTVGPLGGGGVGDTPLVDAAGTGGVGGAAGAPAGVAGSAVSAGGAAGSAAVVTNGIVHPGIMTTLADLQAIKAHLDSEEEPWQSQLERMKSLVERPDRKLHNPGLDNDVGGNALIYCGSYNRNATDTAKVVACDWPVQDGIDAYTLALLGYLTDDDHYAELALRYLESWTNPNNFRGFDPAGSNAPLQHGWTIPWYANTAELLRYTYSGWKPQHAAAMTEFLKRMLPLVEKDSVGAPNNWLHSRIEAQLAAAIFLSDSQMVNTALARWKTHTPSYVYIDADHGMPVMPASSQIAQRGPATWNTPRFVAGMTMETCRDLQHQDLGMRSIFNSLAMAENQGRDPLQGTDIRERLATFLEVMPIWTQSKEDHPQGICNAPVVLQPPTGYLRDATARFPYPIGYKLLYTPERPLLAARRDLELGPEVHAARWVTTWEALTHHFMPN